MLYEIKTYTVKLKVKDTKEKEKITSSNKAFKVLKAIYEGLDDSQEHFVLLTISKKIR